jgi:prevent-host-death family protein
VTKVNSPAKIDVQEAKTHLSRLLARVEAGEEIVIARDGRPIARLVSIHEHAVRVAGSAKGEFSVPDDFDAPLPEEILAGLSVNVLLDTHPFLWWITDSARLSASARRILSASANPLFWRAASAWEVGIKHAFGRLRLPRAPGDYLPRHLELNAVARHPSRSARVSSRCPSAPSRRPFDRMLVAQAQIEDLVVLRRIL